MGTCLRPRRPTCACWPSPRSAEILGVSVDEVMALVDRGPPARPPRRARPRAGASSRRASPSTSTSRPKRPAAWRCGVSRARRASPSCGAPASSATRTERTRRQPRVRRRVAPSTRIHATAANGTMRWPVTASARRGDPGSCSARSRWSAPARSIVPVSDAPRREVDRDRRPPAHEVAQHEAEGEPIGERRARGRGPGAAQQVGMRHPDAGDRLERARAPRRRARRPARARPSRRRRRSPRPAARCRRRTRTTAARRSRSRLDEQRRAGRAARPATAAAARPRCRARRAPPPTRRRADPRGRRRSDPSAPSEARAIITSRSQVIHKRRSRFFLGVACVFYCPQTSPLSR